MKYLFLFLMSFAVFSCTGQQGPPETFLLKPAVLTASLQKIKNGDPEMKKALDTLLKEADEALTKGPYSVTFKSKTPASGDKHDYMSVGP